MLLAREHHLAMAAALLAGNENYWIDTATGAGAAYRSTDHGKQANEKDGA